MYLFGAFELVIQPGTPDNPASVRVTLLRYTRGEGGCLALLHQLRDAQSLALCLGATATICCGLTG
jgi:hypothetical protein